MAAYRRPEFRFALVDDRVDQVVGVYREFSEDPELLLRDIGRNGVLLVEVRESGSELPAERVLVSQRPMMER